MGFILLSGYSTILRISSIVGARSSAAFLPFGRPRVIFFQENGGQKTPNNSFQEKHGPFELART